MKQALALLAFLLFIKGSCLAKSVLDFAFYLMLVVFRIKERQRCGVGYRNGKPALITSAHLRIFKALCKQKRFLKNIYRNSDVLLP